MLSKMYKKYAYYSYILQFNLKFKQLVRYYFSLEIKLIFQLVVAKMIYNSQFNAEIIESDLKNFNNTVPFSLSIVQSIYQSFQNQLHVKKLLKFIPQFNTNSLFTLNQQCVAYFYLEGQSKSQHLNVQPDPMPRPIEIDNIINFHIKIQDSQKQAINQSQQFIQTANQIPPLQQISSLNYSMSKSHHNNSKNSLEKSHSYNLQDNISAKRNQELCNTSRRQVREFLEESIQRKTQNSSSILNKPQLNTSELLPLNLKKQNDDPAMQNQLQKMKKQLYMMRRYRNSDLQKERERLDMLSKKGTPILYNKNIQHTYQYDGTPLQLKKTKDTTLFINQLKPNLTRKNNFKQKNKLTGRNSQKKALSNSISSDVSQNPSFINQQAQETNPERNLSSRQLKKISFDNGNRRQVSHLPFIVLKENAKLIENKKQLSGSSTLRTSLNHSKISSLNSQNTKFRSFAQMEQQKRLQKSRQKVLELTQSNDLLQIDIIPPSLNLNRISEPLRKQSHMMRKYLQKLTEQRSKIERWIQTDQSKKSLNFEQLKVPHKYPIQRYYDYDYEGERLGYQFQITSKMSSHRNSIVSELENN